MKALSKLIGAAVLAGVLFALFLLPAQLALATTGGKVIDYGSAGNNGISQTPQSKTFCANGRHWVFYARNHDIKAKTSTDSQNWSTETTITTMAVGATGTNFSVYFDGVYFSYAWGGGIVGGTSALYYRRGVPNINGTVTWSAVEQTVSDVALMDYLYPDIVVDHNGIAYIIAEYYHAGVSNNVEVWQNSATDGTWATSGGFPHSLTTSIGTTNMLSAAVVLSTNAIMFVYSDITLILTTILASAYYDGSSWSTDTVIDDYNNEDGFGLAVSNDKPAVTFVEGVIYSTGSLDFREYTAGTGWSAPVKLLGGVDSAGSNTVDVTLAALNDTGDYVSFLMNYSQNGSLGYVERAGGVWGDWQTWFAAPEGVFEQGNTSISTGASSVIGVAYTVLNTNEKIYYNYLPSTAVVLATTASAANVSNSTALLQGNVNSLGAYLTVNVSFEYGKTTAYGASGSPTVEQTKTIVGSVSTPVTGLDPEVTYHYRIRVHYGSDAYVYGADATFTTASAIPAIPVAGTTNPDILRIDDVKVFQSYQAANDRLFAIAYRIIYNAGDPVQGASDYFNFQVIVGTNVVASVPVQMWGYRPGSVYIALPSSVPWGSAVTVRLAGYADKWISPPLFDFTLSAGDWVGTNLTQLDKWVIALARNIGNYYNTLMTTDTPTNTVLSNQGGTVFNTGMPGLSRVRPEIFNAYSQYVQPWPSHSPQGNLQAQYSVEGGLGPYYSGIIKTWGTTNISPTQTSSSTWGLFVMIGFALLVIVLGMFVGLAASAIAAVPVIIIGMATGGIQVALLMTIAAVIVMLFFKRMWLERTP